MIRSFRDKSFRDKALREFFETGSSRRLSVPNTARIGRILRALDEAERPGDMDLPGFRFHPLKGPSRGRYAVDAMDVDLEDYH